MCTYTSQGKPNSKGAPEKIFDFVEQTNLRQTEIEGIVVPLAWPPDLGVVQPSKYFDTITHKYLLLHA